MEQTAATTPQEEYSRRLHRYTNDRDWLERVSLRLSFARLVAAVVCIAVLWVVAETDLLATTWLVVPVLAFIALVVLHSRVERELTRARRRIVFYQRGLDRLEDRWVGSGRQGQEHADPDHPYADDLDLFGRGSLYELLCLARSAMGERTLAAWLLAPAAVSEVVERQQAVTELRPRLDLRERLALLGHDERITADTGGLERWLTTPGYPQASVTAQVMAGVVSTMLATGLLAWLFGKGSLLLLVALLLHTALMIRHRGWVKPVIKAVRWPARELGLLSQLLVTLESERFSTALLARLRELLGSGGLTASREIRRLQVVVERLDWSYNMLFSPIAWLLLWHLHQACAAERWRRRCGSAVPRWFDGIGQLEALLCLAGFAAEHPEDPFPELSEEGTTIEATGLTHPLLPADRAVRNDLQLGNGLQALVVSGSNMSGKSTLLRTIGSNVVLAFMGAPVRARRLRLPPLVVGASLCSRDSLLDGRSRFYAEVVRLKQIADLCREQGERPGFARELRPGRLVLFLLDEIFHGTNSHDRRVGAELYVASLLRHNAIGLVTTHDLALAALAETLAPKVGNVHFVDQVVDGELHFDYLLHPGPVERGNALDLMRAVGLIDECEDLEIALSRFRDPEAEWVDQDEARRELGID